MQKIILFFLVLSNNLFCYDSYAPLIVLRTQQNETHAKQIKTKKCWLGTQTRKIKLQDLHSYINPNKKKPTELKTSTLAWIIKEYTHNDFSYSHFYQEKKIKTTYQLNVFDHIPLLNFINRISIRYTTREYQRIASKKSPIVFAQEKIEEMNSQKDYGEVYKSNPTERIIYPSLHEHPELYQDILIDEIHYQWLENSNLYNPNMLEHLIGWTIQHLSQKNIMITNDYLFWNKLFERHPIKTLVDTRIQDIYAKNNDWKNKTKEFEKLLNTIQSSGAKASLESYIKKQISLKFFKRYRDYIKIDFCPNIDNNLTENRWINPDNEHEKRFSRIINFHGGRFLCTEYQNKEYYIANTIMPANQCISFDKWAFEGDMSLFDLESNNPLITPTENLHIKRWQADGSLVFCLEDFYSFDGNEAYKKSENGFVVLLCKLKLTEHIFLRMLEESRSPSEIDGYYNSPTFTNLPIYLQTYLTKIKPLLRMNVQYDFQGLKEKESEYLKSKCGEETVWYSNSKVPLDIYTKILARAELTQSYSYYLYTLMNYLWFTVCQTKKIAQYAISRLAQNRKDARITLIVRSFKIPLFFINHYLL